MADTVLNRRPLTIGPQHAGKRMSLERFARAETTPGYLYELERGIIVVSDVPGVPHARAIEFIRRVLSKYQDANPEAID